MFEMVSKYLKQTVEETVNFEDSIAQLETLFQNDISTDSSKIQ
jgi:hypothetical protein